MSAFVTVMASCNLAGPDGGDLAPPTDGSPDDGTSDGSAGDRFENGHTPNPLSVTFGTEDSSKTSARIAVDGGSLTTTDQAGVTYTLDVPDGALVAPQNITMVPISQISDSPVGSSFAVGVELRPEGLELLHAATVTIETPDQLPATGDARIVGFGAESDGDEFYLKGVEAASTDTVTVSVRHFSGAGAVAATDSEVESQQENHPPTDVRDWAEQELLTDPTVESAIAVLRGVHGSTLASITAAGTDPSFMDQAFRRFRFWRLKYDTARDEVQARLAGEDAGLLGQFITTFQVALVEARNACRNHDLSQIGRLLRWSYLVLSYPDISAGLTDFQSIKEDALGCATFELEFDSYIEGFAETSESDPIITAVEGTIPIAAIVGTTTGISFTGTDALSYTQSQYFPTPGCDTVYRGKAGELSVLEMDLGLNLAANQTPGQPALNLGVYLVPQGLSEDLRISCDGTVILEQEMQHWIAGWASLHLSENTAQGFEIRGWIPGSSGDAVVATRSYAGGNEGFTEQTELRLVHKPSL